MNVVIIGATGGSGRAAVRYCLTAGHRVRAFARRPEKLGVEHRNFEAFAGDATSADDVRRAIEGQDAVIVTLGISENPLRVRFAGPAHTPLDVRSVGTRHVIAAMKAFGVRRLVVQTSYGVGDTRDRLGWLDRIFFSLVLKPQISDTEIQNTDVARSDLDWVIAQPVHLTDDDDAALPFASVDGNTGRMKVSRASVGRFLANAVVGKEFVHRTVSLSGAAAA